MTLQQMIEQRRRLLEHEERPSERERLQRELARLERYVAAPEEAAQHAQAFHDARASVPDLDRVEKAKAEASAALAVAREDQAEAEAEEAEHLANVALGEATADASLTKAVEKARTVTEKARATLEAIESRAAALRDSHTDAAEIAKAAREAWRLACLADLEGQVLAAWTEFEPLLVRWQAAATVCHRYRDLSFRPGQPMFGVHVDHLLLEQAHAELQTPPKPDGFVAKLVKRAGGKK